MSTSSGWCLQIGPDHAECQRREIDGCECECHDNDRPEPDEVPC